MVKKLLSVLGICAGVWSVAVAQPQYIYSTTTTTTDAKPLDDNTNNKRQTLYQPTDFPSTPSGWISDLYIEVTGTTTLNYATFRVAMGYTPSLVLVGGPWNVGLSTVYNFTGPGTVAFPVTAGWIKIHLSNPFYYDNTQNFIVDITQSGKSPGASATVESSAKATNKSLYGASTSANGTLQSRVMKIGFDFYTKCDTVKNRQITGTTLNTGDISWDPVPGAVAYEYVLDQASTDPPGTGYTTTFGTNLTFKGLQPGTCYYVHLRTNCLSGVGVSNWTLDSFCTVADCFTPTVTIDKIASTTARATWDPVQGAYEYEYAVGTSPDPPQAGNNTIYTAVDLRGLAANRPWYFYLRAKCSPTPYSRWGVTPFHTELPTSIDDLSNDQFVIESYPNPVGDVLHVNIFSDISGAAHITMTDLTGKIVRSVAVAGDKAEINTAGLPQGMYLLRYEDNAHTKVTKIIKQ